MLSETYQVRNSDNDSEPDNKNKSGRLSEPYHTKNSEYLNEPIRGNKSKQLEWISRKK